MSNRPNYVLKLADGTERVFTPHPEYDDLWIGFGNLWYVSELEALGATPAPEPEPKPVIYNGSLAKMATLGQRRLIT